MAARNRVRSAMAKTGATGRTVLVSPSAPKDTQATAVGTQRSAIPPSQPGVFRPSATTDTVSQLDP